MPGRILMVKISPACSKSSDSSAQLTSPGGRFLTTTMKRQPHSCVAASSSRRRPSSDGDGPGHRPCGQPCCAPAAPAPAPRADLITVPAAAMDDAHASSSPGASPARPGSSLAEDSGCAPPPRTAPHLLHPCTRQAACVASQSCCHPAASAAASPASPACSTTRSPCHPVLPLRASRPRPCALSGTCGAGKHASTGAA